MHYFRRARNKFQIVVIGGKEFFHQTNKDLHRRIRLECDNNVIDLPSLQGIVIMNIPSYMAGINFWGSNESDQVKIIKFG